MPVVVLAVAARKLTVNGPAPVIDRFWLMAELPAPEARLIA